MKGLEALEELKNDIVDRSLFFSDEKINVIEDELILLNALRNKLNRKVETKEYKHKTSNSYHIATLLTYELKEQWNDKELQVLKQFLLNLSDISNELKALEILKPCCIVADYKCENPEDRYELAFCRKLCITEEEYNVLKEVLK